MTNPNEPTRRARRASKDALAPVRHSRSQVRVGRRSIWSVVGIALSVLLVSGG